MNHYQLPNEHAYLRENDRVERSGGRVCGYFDRIASVLAAELQIEIELRCVVDHFVDDFYYSVLGGAFCRRPVSKGNFTNPPAFRLHIVEEKVAVCEEELKEWLLEKRKELTTPC